MSDNPQPLTCRSCRHTARHGSIFDNDFDGLLCLITRTPAVKRCNQFEYEPGTDEAEAP